MKNTYRPEHPEYNIPEKYATYPRELIFGGNTAEEAVKIAMEQLIAEPTQDSAWRLLDQTEIETYRKEYTQLMENDKTESEARLNALAAEDAAIKEKIRAEREVLQSINTHINDNVRAIKEGTSYEQLDGSQSLRIAVDNHYLHYTFAGGVFILAKVEEVPEKDHGNLFTRQTRNQEVFIRMFGCHFTPSETFEEITLTKKGAKALEGRKLAAAAVRGWTEEFVDEDTGQLVPVELSKEIVTRDTILTPELITKLLEEQVKSVVLYKVKEQTDDTSAA